MKRMLCLLLCAVMLLTMAACGESKDPGEFYYRRSEITYDGSDGVIAAEIHDFSGLRGDPEKLLQQYFLGPQESGLVSPFPRDTRPESWHIETGTLYLMLSSEFAELSGIDLTVACACIARTAFAHMDIQAVSISARDALLNGAQNITLAKSDIHLVDNSLDKLRTELTLYYPDSGLRFLEGHTISVNAAQREELAAYLIEQLSHAPSGYALHSPIPRDAALLDVTVEDGTCTLNFSQEFESNAYAMSHAQRLTLLGIVNTLTQLEDVERVEFYVEGSMIVHYRNLSISKPLVFDESAIGPVRTAVNEFDATLYVCNGSGQHLAAVPTRLRLSGGISKAERIVGALLDYKNANDFYTSVPEGTSIHSVTMDDGICYVDLSQEFLSQTEHILLSVRSIVASLCELEQVDKVQITVEGEIPQGDFGDLFRPISPASDWYL